VIDAGASDTLRSMRARVSGSGPASMSTSSIATAVIVAVGVAVAVVIGVTGDFPLSDDWSYAYAARALCDDGELSFLPWTGASLVFQAWYGAALCKLFGLSFTVLRISTVLLAIVGAVALHALLRALDVDRRLAALAVATCCLGPLYVNLAFTWMTDVPFTVAVVVAGYLYVIGIERDDPARLLIAGIACAAALLIRQHGIFVAAAAALAILGSRSSALPDRLLRASAAAAFPVAVFLGFHLWLFFIHGAPSGLQDKVSEAGTLALTTIGNSAFRGLHYIGVLLVPLAVVLAPSQLRKRPAVLATLAAALSALVVFLYAREQVLMPYLTNVIYDFGLGPLSLRDTQFLGMAPPLQLGLPFGVLLTIGSTAATAVVLTSMLGASRRLGEPAFAFVAYAALLLFAGSLLHTKFYFDRYLLPVLPFAAAVVAASSRPTRIGVGAWATAAALAWFAVAGTHDYMEWNRARYAGIAELERAGATVEDIDGGVEYNAWHLAASLWTWPTAEEARPGKPASQRSWWWVVDDRFVLAFRELEGYDVVREMSYLRLLVPGTGRVLVLERRHRRDERSDDVPS